jgi:hypothetical protein
MQKVADINTRLADEKQQRLTRIRLIQRETAENEPIWKAKQMTMYPTAVPISQTPTLGQVITEEIQNNAMNPDVLYQRAEQKLLQLADKTNTEYILDRLEDEELYYLVNYWDGVMKDLKEKYNSKQLDKNIFIALVKKNSTILKRQLKGIDFDDITTKGKLLKKQKEERLQEIEDETNDKEAKDEAERKRLGDLRNQQVADEEAQKLADKQQQILEKVSKRKLRGLLKKRTPPAPAPAPAPAIPLPTNDDPFKYDPSNDLLKDKYEADFLTDYNEVEEKIKKLDTADSNKLYNELEVKYPNKMSKMNGLTSKSILTNFLKQTLLDKYFDIQSIDEKQKRTQANLEKFKQTTPDKSSAILQRKQDLKKMLKPDLYDEAIKHGKIPKNSNKDALINHILKGEYGMDGYGLQKRRIVGKGMAEGVNDAKKSKESVMKKIINGKYIDLNKLKNNIICIRYCKTRALVPNVKVQHVSNDIKEIINDIIEDKFEKRLYEKLNINDKRLVKRIVDSLKLDIDLHSKEDEEYARQFDVVLGEWKGGNNNDMIKAKLKQYIMESMESGLLPRRECFKLLFELANS